VKNLDKSGNCVDNNRSKFLAHCNDMLRLIDPVENVNFESNQWAIPYTTSVKSKNEKLVAALNFSDFNTETLKFQQSLRIEFQVGEFINLSIVEFAKWLFLQQRHDNTLDYRSVWYLGMLKMLFAYLREHNAESLEPSMLEGFFSLCLTHDFVSGNFIKRLSSPAYGSRFKSFNLANIARTLRLHSVESVVANIHDDDLNKTFNSACLAQMNMTLADYKKGGTFDFLTLDVGKHYIDYCANFFEQNIVFATALRSSLVSLGMDTNEVGKKDEWKLLFNENLDGRLKEQFYQLFIKNYNELVVKYHVFNIEKLNELISKLKLDSSRFDTYEFVRSLLYARYYDGQLKKREHILAEYTANLNSDNAGFSIYFTLQEFDNCSDELLSDELLDFDKAKNILSQYSQQFSTNTRVRIGSYFNDVEAAGVTAFVAYTGWRASEYGFPNSALKSATNKDILDAIYSPFRFYIKWVSPKTNGDTLLEREITLSSSILFKQLSTLSQFHDNGFALTSTILGKNTGIERQIYNMVIRHWQNFPSNYKAFTELDELQLLTAKGSECDCFEQKNKQKLAKKYDLESRAVKELIELRDKLRKDNQVLALVSRKYLVNGKALKFAETIRRYASEEIDLTSKEILENRLSNETLEYIKSNSNSMSESDIQAVIDELTAGIFKATPHALRHIWAEAVLRRYKGDVGKFIRANFKHIDERFFMAYLRGKEARAIMQIAKRTTINHIVSSRIKSLTDERRHYAGQFDRFINKAAVITKVHTQSDYENLANKIASDRIIDIKVNAWNTCVLRKGTYANAMCSENDVPQRHKAAPKLCLGCINGDIEAGNYKGIVVYIKPDIEACRNPNLPMFIKRLHLVTVRLALKRIQELSRSYDDSGYQKFIEYLNETIDMVTRLEEAS
jgi:hypothetical protein